MRKTFPKDGKKKLKETINKLKSERNMFIKKIKFLEDELINLQKPLRPRKPPAKNLTDSEWREEFTRRFKASLKEKNDE